MISTTGGEADVKGAQAAQLRGSFSKAEVTQESTKGRKRKHLQSLFTPLKQLEVVAGTETSARGDDKFVAGTLATPTGYAREAWRDMGRRTS